MKCFSKLYVLYKTWQNKSLCHYVTPLKSTVTLHPFLTFIIGNQYLDKHSGSCQYSLLVQNSEYLKSVIALFIALLVHDLAMQCSFGNKSPFLCEHPFDFFTIHLFQDCSR